MGGEDSIKAPSPSSSRAVNESSELYSSKAEPDSLCCISDCREEKLTDNHHLHKEAGVGHGDDDCVMEIELDKDSVENISIAHGSVDLAETVSIDGKMNGFSSEVHTDSYCLNTQDETSFEEHKKAGRSIVGVKRARMTFDEREPSVHVVYHSLTRASKMKLQELLEQWSKWHVHHDSSSHNPKEEIESGEKTYFPALHVGETSSAVSFWIDEQTSKHNKEFVPLDSKSIPLYDRGYAMGLTATDSLNNLEGGVIVADASRCFNCGSYSHAMKDCPRPRDNVAVNNARKQHNSKRNLNPGSRNPTRYYQNSPAGKYDGLKPGALDPETRKLLGLGELDPPPWLNRMREIGYPPGYLDPDNENQPSGITIYVDDEVIDEQEEGEITEAEESELEKKKMSVEFPGVNAATPPNADEQLWAAGTSSSDQFRSRPIRRSNYSTETSSRDHQRWSRDHRDGPPGVDPVGGLSSSSYPPRYGNYESSILSYSSRGNALGRSFSERGSSPNRDGYSAHEHLSSPYSSRNESRADDSHYDSDEDRDPDSSYHNRRRSRSGRR